MTIDTRDILEQLLDGVDLSEAEAEALMCSLAEDDMAPARAGALLAALRAKGETADEIRGFARGMRKLAIKPQIPAGIEAADCVGTGGDGSGSLNISTGSALLAAACGVPMIKHGNRSISSKSGSADALEKLGVDIAGDADSAISGLTNNNFSFLFAPGFHPAMKNIGPVRAAMGVRTLFNILGPLSNPAEPPYHLIGAFSAEMAEIMAEVLAGLDIKRAFVVHGHVGDGQPGWDEATPCGPFEFYDVTPGSVKHEVRDPQDFGIDRCAPEQLAGGDADENAAALKAVLAGEDKGPHADALALGAGLVLEVTGKASDLKDGIAQARAAIDSGAARDLLEKLAS